MFMLIFTGINCKAREYNPISDRFDPDDQPFAHILPAIKPVLGVGGQGFRAEDCAECHRAIYQEWQQSSHAAAMKDLQFHAELAKKDSPRWLCLNCHAPVENQRMFKVKGLKNNNVLSPVFESNHKVDLSMRAEGVTCAVCHIRNQGEISVIIGPFGSRLAPHPVKKDRQSLNNICERCHNPRGEAVTNNLLCWFETYKEMAEYNRQSNQKYSCTTCHMPETERRLVEDLKNLPLRKTRQHLWVGSGIPKAFKGYETLLERGYQPGLVARSRLKGSELLIFLENISGHYLPTADPERFLLLEVVLYTGNTKMRLLRERIGQTWKWNPARKIADNRLKVHEKRQFKTYAQDSYSKINVRIFHVRLRTEILSSIKASKEVDKSTVKEISKKLESFEEHYPMANLIYQKTFYKNGTSRELSLRELVKLSKAQNSYDRPY